MSELLKARIDHLKEQITLMVRVRADREELLALMRRIERTIIDKL